MYRKNSWFWSIWICHRIKYNFFGFVSQKCSQIATYHSNEHQILIRFSRTKNDLFVWHSLERHTFHQNHSCNASHRRKPSISPNIDCRHITLDLSRNRWSPFRKHISCFISFPRGNFEQQNNNFYRKYAITAPRNIFSSKRFQWLIRKRFSIKNVRTNTKRMKDFYRC